MTVNPEHTSIEVTVTFAAAPGPYQHTYDPAATVATVQADAMIAFNITTGGTDRYFLVHDGVEVPPEDTVGQLAGKARDLHFKLRTETISG
jgi:hypothetical protein